MFKNRTPVEEGPIKINKPAIKIQFQKQPKTQIILIFIFLKLSLVLLVQAPMKLAAAQESFAAYIENDSRQLGGPGSDQAYSNGFKFSSIYAQETAPLWIKKPFEQIPFLSKKIARKRLNFALFIGHQIFTPNNTQSSELAIDDRPYAGWLHAGTSASFADAITETNIELNLGTVGPSAFGEQVQNNYHRFIGKNRANGWKNSINDEPTFQISYQERKRVFREAWADTIFYKGFGIGNVLVAGHVGILQRIGLNLPLNFGPSRPSNSGADSFIQPNQLPHFGYSIFGGGRINAVAHNIFLDGNLLRASHRVDKRPLFAESEVGLGLHSKNINITWSLVTRSSEFYQRQNFNSFASINLVIQK